MASLVVSHSGLFNTTNIGNKGTVVKEVVTKILEVCPELSIHTVVSDTTSTYSVYLQWGTEVDCGIHIYNSSSNVYFKGVGSLSGTAFSPNGNYSTVNTSDWTPSTSLRIEVARYGTSFLGVAILKSGEDYMYGHFQIFKLTDRFTGATGRLCAGYSSTGEAVWVNGAVALCVPGGVTSCSTAAATAGLTVPNGLAIAAPVVFSASDSAVPFSGTVGAGEPELFMCHNNGSQMAFASRYNRFTIGGKAFVNINANCAFIET